MPQRQSSAGYTLVEIMVSISIAALLLTGLQKMTSTSLLAATVVSERTELARSSRFAMGRMVDAVSSSQRLLLPLADNPATNWDEHIRIQTIPASPPQGSSTLATAVLAVTLSQTADIDLDGNFDADNDNDGQFDEDPSGDVTNDYVTGIIGLDDDGDGAVDEAHTSSGPPAEDDDDEDGTANDDGWNGVDDDGDGMTDEDPKKDMSGEGLSGIGGFDDDGDGNVDEDDKNDDDEDGSINEDWFDTVAFYLSGSELIERRPVPWDENGDSSINGLDFVESTIADNVTLLRFERISVAGGQPMVDITLDIAGGGGETISLNTRVRLSATQ